MITLIVSGLSFLFFLYFAWSIPKAKKLLEDESEAMIGIEPQAIHLNKRVRELGPTLIRVSYLLCIFSAIVFIYVLINNDL